MKFPGLGRTLPLVRAELALARSLTATEFAAVKGLRRPLHLPAYIRTLERLEENLLRENKGQAIAQNVFGSSFGGPSLKTKYKWKLRQTHEQT